MFLKHRKMNNSGSKVSKKGTLGEASEPAGKTAGRDHVDVCEREQVIRS